MQKKLKKCICYLLIIFSVMLLSGCSNNNEEKLLKSKLESEMNYLDCIISNMLNKVNGLTFENYVVTAEKIEDESQNEESTSQNSQSGSSSGNEESSTGDSESSNGANSSTEDVTQDNFQYKMVGNAVLAQERTPNWDELTTDIEQIYSNWAVITLDLYKYNIDNQQILEFNTQLDNATKAIKDKNKEQTLTSLAKLYSYIPVYSAGFLDQQIKTNLYTVKSNVFNAYSVIDTNKDEVKKQLELAEETIIVMINNIENQNEYNVNKAYILLKDLQNSINENDTDIFYLKYKNLMQELNIM